MLLFFRKSSRALQHMRRAYSNLSRATSMHAGRARKRGSLDELCSSGSVWSMSIARDMDAHTWFLRQHPASSKEEMRAWV